MLQLATYMVGTAYEQELTTIEQNIILSNEQCLLNDYMSDEN